MRYEVAAIAASPLWAYVFWCWATSPTYKALRERKDQARYE